MLSSVMVFGTPLLILVGVMVVIGRRKGKAQKALYRKLLAVFGGEIRLGLSDGIAYRRKTGCGVLEVYASTDIGELQGTNIPWFTRSKITLTSSLPGELILRSYSKEEARQRTVFGKEFSPEVGARWTKTGDEDIDGMFLFHGDNKSLMLLLRNVELRSLILKLGNEPLFRIQKASFEGKGTSLPNVSMLNFSVSRSDLPFETLRDFVKVSILASEIFSLPREVSSG